jgi:hypothetical protein
MCVCVCVCVWVWVCVCVCVCVCGGEGGGLLMRGGGGRQTSGLMERVRIRLLNRVSRHRVRVWLWRRVILPCGLAGKAIAVSVATSAVAADKPWRRLRRHLPRGEGGVGVVLGVVRVVRDVESLCARVPA